MTIRTRRFSRTLIAVTAAAGTAVTVAPPSQAAPATPQLPKSPLGLKPTVPAAPAKTVTLPATPAPTTPLPTVETTVTRWVSVPVANVRSGPSTSYSITGTKTSGVQVKGTLTSNGWLKISSNQYMAPSVLTSTNPGSSNTVTQYVVPAVGNVRSGPGLNYRIVGTLTAGTKVTGTWNNGWLNMGNGRYISSTILTSSAPGGGGGGGTSVTQYVVPAIGNVRSGPGLNYRIVGTLTAGTKVTGTWNNGWLNMGNGRYISSTILTSSEPGGGIDDGGTTTVTRWVSAPVANVRSGPSTSYSIVGTRNAGTKVTGTISSNGWLKMSGSEYMSPDVLTSTQPGPAPVPPPAGDAVRQGIINTAAKYVGYPYVLYGTPPQAFDCSSYTWYVYQQNGINIPRTVRDQKAMVTRVTDPKPGDLIFYDNFYHVGIYAGPGMTYEALNPQAGVRYGPPVTSEIWYGRVPGM